MGLCLQNQGLLSSNRMSPQQVHPHHSNWTDSPSLQFEVLFGLESRNQHWKFQVSPAATDTEELSVGILVRSNRCSITPAPLAC